MIDYGISAGSIDSRTIEGLARLVEVCFGKDWTNGFAERVAEKPKPCAVFAKQGGASVGFKLGYERSREEFYSWLGGVHPEHRRRGVALELMKVQHDWCRRNGYRLVMTEALSDNAAMLILNLKAGFRIVGTRLDERGLKVVMSRML